MPNYIYQAGAVHNDNSQHITIEHVTKDMLLALVNHATQPQASAPAEACEIADAQVINEKKPAKPRKKTVKKPTPTVQLERMTFALDRLSDSRLKLLHDFVTNKSMIACPFADFARIFEGRANDCQLTWTDEVSRPTLVALFDRLAAEKLIRIPEGFTLINILKGHFLDMDGLPLTGLDKGNPVHPKHKTLIDECIRLLNADLSSIYADRPQPQMRNLSHEDRAQMHTSGYHEPEDEWVRIERGDYD